MFDWLIHRRIRAFERQFGYDMGYAHELLNTTRKGFWHYLRVSSMAQHRDGVPLAPWFAAKLVAVHTEDCGPCTQLTVNMARAQGVSDELLRALLRGDIAALDADTALAVRYTEAAVTHAPQLLYLRDAVVQRWGERGLASLALSITGTRMFPMLKYALGHGQSCQRVQVGVETVASPSKPAHAL